MERSTGYERERERDCISRKFLNFPSLQILLQSCCFFFSPWQDEFCTYMLLEYQEKELMAGEKLPPFPYPMNLMHKYVENTIRGRGRGDGIGDLSFDYYCQYRY